MADSFEYTAPTGPLRKDPFSFQDLLGSMSAMKPANVSFVGGMYGDPGTGKTTNGMRLMQRLVPADKKILYVYTGVNWSSLMNEPHLMNRVVKMPFKSYAQLEKLGEMLSSPEMVKQLGFGGVIFDEFNTMHDIDLDAVTNYRAAEFNAAQAGKALPKYKDPDTPEWPEYNTGKARVINLLNNVLAAEELHYLFICHPRQGNKSKKIEPDFPDKTAQAFIRALHSLYYLEKDTPIGSTTIDWKIRLQGDSGVVAKNRIGGLPDIVRSTDDIADAFDKWGFIEGEAPTEKIPEKATEKPAASENVGEEQKPDAVVSEAGEDPFAMLNS